MREKLKTGLAEYEYNTYHTEYLMEACSLESLLNKLFPN